MNFGTALKDWRIRRHLSQLDLALRAGTTQRHVSFMESGRSLPGRGMVLRVAESLELPLRERNGLLYTAGFAPSYPETRLDSPAIKPVLDGLRRLLDGHRPYPAIVVDRYGVLVAKNDAFGLLTEGVAPELLEEPVDTLRLALHPEGMAPRVRNLDDWARHILERIRNDLARNPDDRLAAQLAELESYLPPASPPAPDHLGFAVPVRLSTSVGELRLITAITTFATAADVTVSELKLETFLPADAETAEALLQTADAVS
ncbi:MULTISPECIES: helix-turn-helix transcriptional regulator [unclassified Amycolatopsis]|uniref:helix-turn-helix transcriptional regulator n=1 Tax=unclassified Amycolatopsis TaxID=2618356 RepID=UPI002E12071C|nr:MULTISPECIES: helix-turn-helix transcriptional regulator [unclassified Amycolatopsis]WSJ74100.1 helix-turn-helix transcriptional regulator [Amycolatopsis sp. NBC_01307]WSK82266.1 helix-turn-helix transcriptional regulator [Amycolatopsis sp. NBC_01286]